MRPLIKCPYFLLCSHQIMDTLLKNHDLPMAFLERHYSDTQNLPSTTTIKSGHNDNYRLQMLTEPSIKHHYFT